jgi:hypothetical protein
VSPKKTAIFLVSMIRLSNLTWCNNWYKPTPQYIVLTFVLESPAAINTKEVHCLTLDINSGEDTTSIFRVLFWVRRQYVPPKCWNPPTRNPEHGTDVICSSESW